MMDEGSGFAFMPTFSISVVTHYSNRQTTETDRGAVAGLAAGKNNVIVIVSLSLS